jgi:DNA polymerase III epsilon subunit-like protein
MKEILLVVGAAALKEPRVEPWVRAEVRKRLQDSTVRAVLTGGTTAERWAATEAQDAGRASTELRFDAGRYENSKRVGNWLEPFAALNLDGRGWFNACDEVLVSMAKKAIAAGWKVKPLILHAEWSKEIFSDRELAFNAFDEELRLPRLDDGEEVYSVPPQPDVVWFDLETGGMSDKNYPIIEIGAVRTDPSHRHVIGTFETKLAVPAGMLVEYEAAQINGYTDDLWRDAPEASVALKSFLKWLPPSFVPAGYSVSFDMRFLRTAFSRYALPTPGWSDTTIDPLYTIRRTLKKRNLVENSQLATACEYYKIYNDTKHRALADAERARLVYLKLMGHEAESSIFPNKGNAI